MTPATTLTLTGIYWYQRLLSPHKGFSCAHAAYFGGPSCSSAVVELLQTRGLRGAWPDIVARFGACRLAYEELRNGGRSVLGSASGRGSGPRVRGLCCCGPIPIPFRLG